MSFAIPQPHFEMPPKEDGNDPDPQEVLLPSILAQLQRGHVMLKYTSNPFRSKKHYRRYNYLVGCRAWLGAQAATEKVAVIATNPDRKQAPFSQNTLEKCYKADGLKDPEIGARLKLIVKRAY